MVTERFPSTFLIHLSSRLNTTNVTDSTRLDSNGPDLSLKSSTSNKLPNNQKWMIESE